MHASLEFVKYKQIHYYFFLDFMVDFSNQLHLYHEKTIKSLNIFHKATSSVRFKSTFICIYYESTFISGNAVVTNSTFVW